MFGGLIFFPIFLAGLAFLIPWQRVRLLLVPMGGLAHLLLTTMLLASGGRVGEQGWLGTDHLGLLILAVVSLLFFCCSIYAVGYLRFRAARGDRIMVACLLLFLSAMTLAALARHLGVLWVAVEATTLVSAPLIYFNRNRLSIEATWKYLLICSVGIALAMLGILFIAYASLFTGEEPSLQLDRLLLAAPGLSRPWLQAGFIFFLVGFGTKMGLAPLHTWKPDAYGEAPGLVGALLAGGLTSVAFLAILRGVQIMGAAGELGMARQALLALGFSSLLFAAVFMIRQPDIKRLLAYSSVEHMGILAVGLGIGGLATFGAMFHIVNNALTKGVLFLTAGNIHRAFASKRLGELRGAFGLVPLSAAIFLAGFLAITGSPPFGPFMSEFTILRGIFADGRYAVGGFFLLLLAVIFIGMGSTVLPATLGQPPEKLKNEEGYRDTLLMVAPPLFMLLLVLLLGIFLPVPLREFLARAAALVEVGS